jgi:hypothetical protein
MDCIGFRVLGFDVLSLHDVEAPTEYFHATTWNPNLETNNPPTFPQLGANSGYWKC